MGATVGLNVLAKDTGEKPRILMHWADLGIIRAEPETDKRGRGRYRAFRSEPFHGERRWALVAAALAHLRVPLGDVRGLITVLRALRGSDPRDGDDAQIQRFKESPFYDALIGANGTVLVLLSLDEKARHDPYSDVFRFVRSPSDNGLERMTDFLREHPRAFVLNLTE